MGHSFERHSSLHQLEKNVIHSVNLLIFFLPPYLITSLRLKKIIKPHHWEENFVVRHDRLSNCRHLLSYLYLAAPHGNFDKTKNDFLIIKAHISIISINQTKIRPKFNLGFARLLIKLCK